MALRAEWDPGQELVELCADRGASALFIAGPLLDISPHLVVDERVRDVVRTAVAQALNAGWSLNDVRYVLGESVTDGFLP